ncbi:MAG: peptidase M28 [Acidobacteria bacterium OLB17]|nr:MAG: peptidase M28 [Acidobacteria bacterium OLB17]
MKRLALLLVTLCAGLSAALGQNAAPTPELYSKKTLDDLVRIQKAATTGTYAFDQARYMSATIGPRLTGSPEAAFAVKYMAEEMRKLGLDVQLQKVMVPHWVREVETAELVEWNGMPPGVTRNVVVTALGHSIATPPNGITADVVVVNDFAELERLGRKNIEGKIVLFNYKFNMELQAGGFGLAAYGQSVAYRTNGAAAAAKYGAVAAIVRSAGGSQSRLAHTGLMRYQDGVPKIPSGAVALEDAETIAYLAERGPVKMHLTLTPQTLPPVESYNVIADLKGTEKPNEYVIVSGHLDSWDLAQGAVDDAAGVAAAYAVPAILKELGLRPKRTIRFIAWMDEEQGGSGSAAYFAAEKNNVKDHFAAIEADLGASHPLGLKYAGKPELQGYFGPLVSVLTSQGAALVQYQPGGVGADIGPLTQAGVPRSLHTSMSKLILSITTTRRILLTRSTGVKWVRSRASSPF